MNTLWTIFADHFSTCGRFEVTAAGVKPVTRGGKVRRFNGPQAAIPLPGVTSAGDVYEATLNNAYGYFLLAAIHERVCDASRLEEALERLYASYALRKDTDALLQILGNQGRRSVQISGGVQ